MMKLLAQLQLSNYDSKGTWILEADSGFQMVFGRIREMLKINPELNIDVLGPRRNTLRTQPEHIVPSVFETNRVNWIEIDIVSNALVTRYDYNFEQIALALHLGEPDHQRYDAIYINDPMLLRHYKALFLIKGKYRPKYFVHSHFVDVESCPKFPTEASLWLGQCEAAIKADYNFWQCGSALKEFEQEARKTFRDDVVDAIMAKSEPSDDGYSQSEITSPINEENLRFTVDDWNKKTQGKTVLFFPNRISPSSGDYTNGIRWMFEFLPKLRQMRQDFVVVCGNPNQKFTNKELEEKCGKNGYVSLTPDSFNRDEYKFVASHSDIALGLYDADAYGGTSARECIELGCCPLWISLNEYLSIAREANCDNILAKPDMSDLVDVASAMIDGFVNHDPGYRTFLPELQRVVRQRCSYEQTVPKMLQLMGLC